MIKLSGKIYIHWLTVLLFASAYITRTLSFTVTVYSVMLLHELAHSLAAKFLGLGVGRIVFYPFGLSLSVKTRILCSFSDEIILYASGPLINAVIASVLCVLGVKNLFFYNNLALFVLNLLPVSQLDGGRIFSAVAERWYGYKTADKLIKTFTIILSLVTIYLFYCYRLFDLNKFSFVAFLVGNAVTEKRKYNRDRLRQYAVRRKKPQNGKVKLVVTDAETIPQMLVDEFTVTGHTVVLFTDRKGVISDIKTDEQIINEILE